MYIRVTPATPNATYINSFLFALSASADSEENKAKYKWALIHFEKLNEELSKSGIDQHYIFHFLSPENYTEFTEYALNDKLFEHEFRNALELKLSS